MTGATSEAGYDVVVDVDEDGDLGHTDLQEDLEFHSSNFNNDASTASNSRKGPGAGTGLPIPATANTGSPKYMIWSLPFYAQFFDVDTAAVLSRCWATIYPRANFIEVLGGNPDLYGPLWIATTVVFILFLGGTINQYLSETNGTQFVYDFTLLSG
ncbi:Yip1-domain-containing protein [Erysiphe pulchra]|uniref:Yip1-domain-containing protein n=1 Tax=Erysiphe pulchra TaxID=225359 RepID=A0A2S4PTR9_9PEZI|nr:Yip1-domain-containing protein [Erysiphe pulchra]